MRLVIDSNRVIAALLKDSTTREVLFHEQFDFYAPDYLVTEIKKYRSYLSKKTKMAESQIDIIFQLLLSEITLVPYDEFEEDMKAAIETMKNIDIKDAPFLAVGMAVGADGIWTEDKHFHKQEVLKTYSTKELIDVLY